MATILVEIIQKIQESPGSVILREQRFRDAVKAVFL